ncbi:MAG: 6-phospho-beta-glucosidase [Oscillospiraceae bacterium]|nr:6-phospho-beta-glucosidase [Oscillospiraceae bacterium]
MNKNLKIATIGGGSSYTPELVEGFIRGYEKLPVKELWLVDIEEGREKLKTVSALAQRMVEKAGLPLQIIPTLNRREALEGADFVTTQMRVGLLEARIKDERISIANGMIGQETNGAGGMFKGFRTIPVILDIVKDIQELCPDAYMLNFSNPAGMISEAIVRYTDYKKSIGLCNVPIGMQNGFAKLLGVDRARVRMEIQGSNHFIFATDIFLDGASVFDQVLNAYIDNKDNASMRNIDGIEYSADLIKGLNAIPCPYHNYYFHTQDQLVKQNKEYENNEVRGEVVKKTEDALFELYKDHSLSSKPAQLEQRGGALYSDAACNLINSIYNNTGDIQYVNIKNNGTVTNLPNDCVVEAACVITADGPKAIALGALKPEINGYIQMIKSFEHMAVKAAVEGDRAAAIAALNMNPLCPSDALANQVFDALLEAHRAYLPQF